MSVYMIVFVDIKDEQQFTDEYAPLLKLREEIADTTLACISCV